MSATVLSIESLTRTFGPLRAVDDIGFSVREREIVGIVGTNGSGKTTLINLITGYLRPSAGRILFGGADITGLRPRRVTELGIARSFQIPQLYTGLSVMENALIAVAIHAGHAANLWSPLYRDAWVEEAAAVLDRFGLATSAAQPVSSLPEGARKLLDVALSFIQQPKLLLMDEPTSGVSAGDKFGVMDTLMPALRDRGVTTIFVEHDMEIVQRYAQRALAFANGRVIADGPVAEVLTHPDVRRSVLGED